MARPRAFDETKVLDAAAGEFRVHGFSETSTEQLCEAAGVRRSSLYNAFESKDELFVRALEYYVQVTVEAQERVLTDPNLSGQERIEGLMELILGEEADASSAGHAAGCMTVQSYMDPKLRQTDPRITRILDRGRERQLTLMQQALRAGQADGSLGDVFDIEDAAGLILTLISGIRVAAQADSTLDELQRIASLALRTLTT